MIFFNRILDLYKRYATACFWLPTSTDTPLVAPDGHVLGHIESLSICDGWLRLEGRADATLTRLQLGAVQVSMVPKPKPDADQLHGFNLLLRFHPDEAALPHLTLSGGATGAPVTLPVQLPGLKAAHRRLLWAFARDLTRSIPAIGLWLLTSNTKWRSKVRRTLTLTSVTPAQLLPSDLFVAPGCTAKPLESPAITIILPVYNAFDLLDNTLSRVVRNTDVPWHLILIEDASSDAQVRPWLKHWAQAQNRTTAPDAPCVTLIENAKNLGFIASVNLGLARALPLGNHVVLLNSDAFVPPNWASRLIRPLLLDDTVATVTPMSNDAEIYTAPLICKRQVLQPGQGDLIDRTAAKITLDKFVIETPTGVGFCMAIRLQALRQLPQLDLFFGRGYGEEVDWCQKARNHNWRHVLQPGLFVEHQGGQSFGSAEKQQLMAHNNAVISKRYPYYDYEVQEFIATDVAFAPRLALALAWAGAVAKTPVPVFLAHALGGGAEHWLAQHIRDGIAVSGGAAVVLRIGGVARWEIELHNAQGMIAGGTDDFALVERLLAPLKSRRIVYSCGVGDSDPLTLPGHLLALAQDGTHPIEVLFHDFFPISPGYTLLDSDGIYRGPVLASRRDPAHVTSRADGRKVTLPKWQKTWGKLISAAEQITVFSPDSKAQVCGTYPQTAGRIVIQPHSLAHRPERVNAPDGPQRVIGVLGNIGAHKGAAVLRDLAQRLPSQPETRLVLVGQIDPAFALPDHVPVHGPYGVDEVCQIARHYGITHWLIPSVWPETFSFTTHETLSTGLPVLAFDIGAQGKTVADAPNGVLIPYAPQGDLVQLILNALEPEQPSL